MAQGRNNAVGRGRARPLRAGGREAHQLAVLQARRSRRSPTCTAGSRRCSSTWPTARATGSRRRPRLAAGSPPRVRSPHPSGWCPHPARPPIRMGEWSRARLGPRADRRRSGAVPPRRPGGGDRDPGVRGGRRGRDRARRRSSWSTPLDPGLVLMDINLPGINGIEATRRITAAHPRRRRAAALDLPGRRPPRGRRLLRRGGVREQGGVRPRRRPRRLGALRPFAGSVPRRITARRRLSVSRSRGMRPRMLGAPPRAPSRR